MNNKFNFGTINPNLSETSFCWPWSLTFKSFTWYLISQSNAKPLFNTTFSQNFAFLIHMNLCFLAFSISPQFCRRKGKDVPTSDKKRPTKFVMIKTMTWNKVHIRYFMFHNMFKLQSSLLFFFYRVTVAGWRSQVPCEIRDFVCPFLAYIYSWNLFLLHSYLKRHLLSPKGSSSSKVPTTTKKKSSMFLWHANF